MLRNWQAECVTLAIKKYKSDHKHFFCQATPGAGKTIMAAEIAAKLIEHNMVDLILCFSPSSAVSEGIRATFSKRLSCVFNGGLGSIGHSLTYQSLQHLHQNFWQTIKKYKVFIVFDEIHHCSGDDAHQGNAWGQQILTNIQNLANYTLALSGTPWRSDHLPIVLSNYSNHCGKIVCDYQYTLRQAICDGVCRSPKIVLADSEQLVLTEEGETKYFSSISDLMKHPTTSYRNLISNEQAIDFLLNLACEKLSEIRIESPNAGGLIVAASVEHAKYIYSILINKFRQSVTIVTYHHDAPLDVIELFRQSTTQWIVSIGMISEGTDIPRLQVCCHLSTIKTELYFRQVLGRILRVNNSVNQEAWLYTYAEDNLTRFAEAIEEDIPESYSIFNFARANSVFRNDIQECSTNLKLTNIQPTNREALYWGTQFAEPKDNAFSKLSSNFEFDELSLGQFKQRLIEAFV